LTLSSYFITREKPDASLATRVIGTGDPHTSLDIAFIAEGYTQAKWKSSAATLNGWAEIILAEAPFDKYS
jgi:hypothetical protein